MKFLRKILRIGGAGKSAFFLVGQFEFEFEKKYPMKTTLGFKWGIIFYEILMITLVSSPKQPFYTILHTTVIKSPLVFIGQKSQNDSIGWLRQSYCSVTFIILAC